MQRLGCAAIIETATVVQGFSLWSTSRNKQFPPNSLFLFANVPRLHLLTSCSSKYDICTTVPAYAALIEFCLLGHELGAPKGLPHCSPQREFNEVAS